MTKTLNQTLSDGKLAWLHVKFEAPLAVSRMLNGDEPLDDVAEYALHDLLGSMKPETALLGIALCAQRIGARASHLPIARTLNLEANRIVDEYGPLWLSTAPLSESLDRELPADVLANVPDDLESLGDLLLTTCGKLDDNHPVSGVLCEILGNEAHMHAAEADADFVPEQEPAREQTQGNVVMFPRAPKLSFG